MAVVQGSVLVGDRLLEMLRAWGIEYVFSSPGSDWPPLWEALAKAQAQGQPAPKLFTCRHEQLAVCLAIGYHRGTQRLPVVVLHTGVGALHTAMMLRSAFQERIPMLVMIGEPTVFGEDPDRDIGAQWLRTLADVGGPHTLVAPYVKWSGDAPDPATLGQVLQHAADVALEPPCGPALVAVPVEDLAGIEPAPTYLRGLSPRREAWPAPDEVRRAADALLEAERPLIVTETAGREPANVGRLVALAEALAAPVVEAQTPAYLNFPRDHRLHQGYAAVPLVSEADVVLLAGCTVPWHPASRWPRPEATVIALSDDPAQDLLPIAGYRVDVRLSGSVSSGLERLAEEVVARVGSLPSDRAQRMAERRASLEERHLRQRSEWEQIARRAADARPIDATWLAYVLRQAVPEDAILVEETTTDKQALLRLLPRTLAGTYHVRSTGGLGVMLGVAQGLKLASPNQLVLAVIGDGAFHYSPALAAFGFAHQYGHPLLVILSDNGAYVSMRSGHDRMYPEGWAVRTGVHPGTDIEPRPDYPSLARAYGGHAERVEDPRDLPGAVDRALERVRAGQWAFLDVVTSGVDARPPR